MSASPGRLVELEDIRGQELVTDAADVVIVGTGAAGATAGRVLTEAGLDVVMIEEGPNVRTEEFRQDALTGFRRLWRNLGFQVAEGRAFIPVLQGRAVGGTTVINGAIIHRLPVPIHDGWRRAGAIDDLLAYEELERVWDVMDRELNVVPVPEEVLGRNNSLMGVGLDATGATGNVILRNVKDCLGSARCNNGCRDGRKLSMDLSYVPRSIAAGARIYATCRAERIVSRSGRATGVAGRFRDPLTGAKGPAIAVEARRAVILAASAIQTPLLLARTGLGRWSRVLGRRFQGHPGTSVLAVFDEPVKSWFGATQGYESTHYWGERMKFETIALQMEVAAARLPGYGPELMKRIAEFGHVTAWGVQVRARAHGSVRRGALGGTRIRYDLDDRDLQVTKRGVRRLIEMAFAAGAREVYPGAHGLPERMTHVDEASKVEELPDDPGRFHYIVSHLFGTATMHGDPERGVVAPDGQCHELPGLYVADSSVFPTNMGVNPQHSICAVAWLIAERVADS